MIVVTRFAWGCPRCGAEGPAYVHRDDPSIRAGWAVHTNNCEGAQQHG